MQHGEMYKFLACIFTVLIPFNKPAVLVHMEKKKKKKIAVLHLCLFNILVLQNNVIVHTRQPHQCLLEFYVAAWTGTEWTAGESIFSPVGVSLSLDCTGEGGSAPFVACEDCPSDGSSSSRTPPRFSWSIVTRNRTLRGSSQA